MEKEDHVHAETNQGHSIVSLILVNLPNVIALARRALQTIVVAATLSGLMIEAGYSVNAWVKIVGSVQFIDEERRKPDQVAYKKL
mmetsp:Transcript_23643/g.29791  ORF Transcript_23643/g.29791 Transcript_23643/m.29791 type:complete len:85 (+) Transcript_23643:558-812(+)